MNRASGLEHIQSLRKTATAVGITLEDGTYPKVGTALDNAMRAIGVSEDSLSNYDVPATNIPKFIAALRLFVLAMMLDELAPLVDMSVDRANRVDKKRSQHFSNVQKLYDKAEAAAAMFGIVPGKRMTLHKIKMNSTATGAEFG